MARPPMFTKKELEAAAAAIRDRGAPDVDRFLNQEPALDKYVQSVVSKGMERLFQGQHPSNHGEQEFYRRVAKELHFACVKILVMTRECYRGLAEHLLTEQFTLGPGPSTLAAPTPQKGDEQEETEGPGFTAAEE